MKNIYSMQVQMEKKTKNNSFKKIGLLLKAKRSKRSKHNILNFMYRPLRKQCDYSLRQ